MNGGIYKKEIQNQILLNAQQMNGTNKKKKKRNIFFVEHYR